MEGEGEYLSRVAAYVRERISARSVACDAFAPRAPKEPPNKAMEDVSMNSTSAKRHLPNNIATFPLLTPESNPGLPSALISPASPNDIGRHMLNVFNKEEEANATCSPEVEHEGLPSVKIPNGRQELLMEAAEEFKCSDEHASRCQGPTIPVLASLEPPDTADAKRPKQEVVSTAARGLLLPSPASSMASTPPTFATPTDPPPAYSLPRSSLELEFRLRWKPPDCEKESKRHACYAVNNRLQPSVIEHLPLPGTALTLSISRSSLAYVTRAIPPRRPSFPSSLQVREQRSVIIRRCAAKIVNNSSTSQSAGLNKRSPTHEAAFMLLIFLLASPRRVEAASHAGAKLVWCARYKPHDVMGAIQQLSAGIISADPYVSARRLPSYEAVRAIPARLLAFSTRAVNPRRPNNELVGPSLL
ncbi:hypothetical protein AX14_006832 [Amanita brunnescens Koide BX004]|nr:hypothetical protein AX14_006832 [Amanita brunnescens Koide BX004]